MRPVEQVSQQRPWELQDTNSSHCDSLAASADIEDWKEGGVERHVESAEAGPRRTAGEMMGVDSVNHYENTTECSSPDRSRQ